MKLNTSFSMHRVRKILLILLLILISGCTTNNTTKKTETESYNFPKPVVWKTANGMSAWLIESNDIPMVDVQLTFIAGSALDNTLSGLSSITNELIFQGSQNLTEKKINEQTDNLGAELGGSSKRDMGIIKMRCLSGNIFSQCMELLTKIVKNPIFSAENIAQSVERRIVSLNEDKKQPSTIASRLLWKNIFVNHPYGLPPKGRSESIKKIKPKHLHNFFNTYYTAQNAKLVIVGNIKYQQAKKVAERISRQLPQGSKAQLPPQIKTKPVGKLIEYPLESKQNHIRIGHLGVKRQDRNYVAFYLANHAIGGGALSSVLGNEIREKRGWAYSVGSYNLPMLATGPFTVYMQTKGENSKDAIKLLTKILSNSTKYLSDDAINRSRNYLLGNFPLQLNSNAKILSYMSVINFYDLPVDYLNNFNKKLKKVTNKEIRKAWETSIDVSKMIVVNVGKI